MFRVFVGSCVLLAFSFVDAAKHEHHDHHFLASVGKKHAEPAVHPFPANKVSVVKTLSQTDAEVAAKDTESEVGNDAQASWEDGDEEVAAPRHVAGAIRKSSKTGSTAQSSDQDKHEEDLSKSKKPMSSSPQAQSAGPEDKAKKASKAEKSESAPTTSSGSTQAEHNLIRSTQQAELDAKPLARVSELINEELEKEEANMQKFEANMEKHEANMEKHMLAMAEKVTSAKSQITAAKSELEGTMKQMEKEIIAQVATNTAHIQLTLPTADSSSVGGKALRGAK